MDSQEKYSREELKEFEALVMEKLRIAKEELKDLKTTMSTNLDDITGDTFGKTKVIEDGAETAEKENATTLAARQVRFIENLEEALQRLKYGTYGICVVTGKKISKERLRAVPHTKYSIEAKRDQN